MTPTAAATITSMEADVDPCPWVPGTRNPWVTRKPTREHQKIPFNTTAEPIPWVPRAKPVSAPVTPDWVNSR